MDAKDRPLSGFVRLKLTLTRAALSGVARMVGLDGLYRLVSAFAVLEWVVGFSRRRRFKALMVRLFPDGPSTAHSARASRQFFIRTRCDKVFYLIFDRIPRDEILSRITMPQHAAFDADLARGRGIYVALCHLGAHHVAGLAMCLLGYDTAGVRDRNEGPARRYIQHLYAKKFEELSRIRIFFSDAFPRDLYRALRDNCVLGSALDVDRKREPHLKRAAVQIFGEQRHYLTGTMQIAMRCGSPIYLGLVISHPGFRYELVTKPMHPGTDGSEDPELLQSLMQQYATHIEEFARAYPHHVSRL
jgi:lauroyl/myristoyl acyltransferase